MVHTKSQFDRFVISQVSVWAEKVHELRYERGSTHASVDFSIEDFFEFLRSAGITGDATIFLHSSWDKLKNVGFRPSEMLTRLIEWQNDSGNLCMPAFPSAEIQLDRNAIFDVNKTPSAAGFLTELFRRFPDVKRSLNLNHSVCAYGPLSGFLLDEHAKSLTSWDEYSPYYKLRSINNAWIVGIGVGTRLKVATALHCAESALWRHSRYFSKLFNEKVSYRSIDANGSEGRHSFLRRDGAIFPAKIAKFFSSNELIEANIKGIDLYAINARLLIDRSIALASKGETMYLWPYPFKHLFD